MKKLPGFSFIAVCFAVFMFGLITIPVTAAICDGPPQSQSFILFSGGCDRSVPGLPCTQGFMFPAQPSVGGDFPSQYFLDFGDGSQPYYGQVDGVTHTYSRPGIFTLKYMAGTQCDFWISGTYLITIPAPANYSSPISFCVPVLPSSGFVGSPTSGVAPLTVQFTSTSRDADAYFWDFGDGGMSMAQNPRHTYRTPGSYPVSLAARDTCSGQVQSAIMNDYIAVNTPVTTLSLSSNPPGASVFIDNVIKGKTPLTLTDIAVGNHQITIIMDDYEEYTRKILVEATSPLTIAAVLTKSLPQPTTQKPVTGSIAITTIPSGAEVYIDDKPIGITPAIFPDLLPGNHRVTLTAKGYEDWSYIVSVGSDRMSAVNAELSAIKEITGSLAIITNPPGAEIFIDGDFKGVSPETVSDLSPGAHTVLVILKDYTNATANISVQEGQTQKYAVELKKVLEPSAIDLLLAAGAIVMIAGIALLVMFRKDPKNKMK